VIEPIRIAFEVACEPDHAFRTWTARASSWWPVEHTESGERGTEIVFEPHAGGRIFERTQAGQEIEWGEITEWDPPRRLRYQWHIAADPADATNVEIVFKDVDGFLTRVEIEHDGWDRLGEAKGSAWRGVNHGGWDGVLPAYRAELQGGSA
jgi:uncharacterized protein YndB with AHSA1/START domain